MSRHDHETPIDPPAPLPGGPEEDMRLHAERIKSVHEAISWVMERVGYVLKQHAPGLGYSFAGEAGLIRAVRAECVAAGLVLTVEEVAQVERGSYKTAKGSTMQTTVVRVVGRWTHWPSATSCVVSALGEGADVGDKSGPKSMTSGHKYLLRETFMLETGDDPDRDASEPRAAEGPQAPQDARPAQARPSGTTPAQARPAGAQGAPRGKAGRGGPNQACQKCGAQGVTPRNFDPDTKRPDAECPGFQGAQPCPGNPKQQGDGFWPLTWWTVPKGQDAPPPPSVVDAARDAVREHARGNDQTTADVMDMLFHVLGTPATTAQWTEADASRVVEALRRAAQGGSIAGREPGEDDDARF